MKSMPPELTSDEDRAKIPLQFCMPLGHILLSLSSVCHNTFEACKCGKYKLAFGLPIPSFSKTKNNKQDSHEWEPLSRLIPAPCLSWLSPAGGGPLSSCSCCLWRRWGHYSFLFFQSAKKQNTDISRCYQITLYHLAICFRNFLKITAWKFKNSFQNCYDSADDSWALHWNAK